MVGFKKIIFNNTGITEILGTVFLLGISVAVFSIVYLSVLSMPHSSPTPSCDIYFSLIDTNISLVHFGGDKLPLDTMVRINIGDELPITKKVFDHLDEKSKNDTFWGFGEQFLFNAGENVLLNSVKVEVVDIESNAIISIGERELPVR